MVIDMDAATIEALGYAMPLQDSSGDWHALCRFIYTWAIIGCIDQYGYRWRWCYHSRTMAEGAYRDWAAAGFEGRPVGWHRELGE